MQCIDHQGCDFDVQIIHNLLPIVHGQPLYYSTILGKHEKLGNFMIL